MKEKGILLPIYSLPSKYGIGDFGYEAYQFIDILSENNIKYWEILPINECDKHPYSPVSYYALEEDYISVDKLKEVKDQIRKAKGGILFIDEAYSLNSDTKGSFEDEAIATLIKEMEDKRDDICVILAGYQKEMQDLIKRNPGFESRIQFYLDFPNYNENELYEIFKKLAKKEGYKISRNIKPILQEDFKEKSKKNNFSNGRYVRNIYEKIKIEQANRILKENDENINLIKKSDIEKILETENKRCSE